MDYYIYLLLDSSKYGEFKYADYIFEYEPFYVGKGKADRIKNTLYDKSRFKSNKIKSLKSKGAEIVTYKLLEGLNDVEAKNLEKELISLIGRRDKKLGPLVNTTDGGDGRLASPHSDEIRRKISQNRKGKGVGWKHKQESLVKMRKKQKSEGNGFWGKHHTEEKKEKHSKLVSGHLHPMYDKKHKDETIKKLKEHRKEKISNEKIKESCQKFNKVVLMYDLNFNLLNEFKSVKEASQKTSINASIISKCCRGDIKSPTRFIFRYKNEKDRVKNNKFKIKVGEMVSIEGSEYRLIKRNRKSCIVEKNNEIKTLRGCDFPILFEKEVNKNIKR